MICIKDIKETNEARKDNNVKTDQNATKVQKLEFEYFKFSLVHLSFHDLFNNFTHS